MATDGDFEVSEPERVGWNEYEVSWRSSRAGYLPKMPTPSRLVPLGAVLLSFERTSARPHLGAGGDTVLVISGKVRYKWAS